MAVPKGVEISFADREYLLYPDGSLWSSHWNKEVTGRNISPANPRKIIQIKVKGVKRGCLISRLVYFFFKYNPEVLKKEKPSYLDFKKMPIIYHKGKVTDDRIQNLRLIASREALGLIKN